MAAAARSSKIAFKALFFCCHPVCHETNKKAAEGFKARLRGFWRYINTLFLKTIFREPIDNIRHIGAVFYFREPIDNIRHICYLQIGQAWRNILRLKEL